ncbi:MAG: DUF116 domain-containing protein [Candidatus Saliniplasma sp.]
MMKEVISKAMSSGLDFTRRGALKSFLNKIEIDEDLYDQVYITIKNKAYKKVFDETPKRDIIIFLPQCLRNTEKCEAELTDEGYKCNHCGACSISNIIKNSEELGYGGVFVVPGGSLVRNIIKNKRPGAVVGVACNYELVEGIEHATIHNVPTQGIPLLRDGCKDTEVDEEEVLDLLDK